MGSGTRPPCSSCVSAGGAQGTKMTAPRRTLRRRTPLIHLVAFFLVWLPCANPTMDEIERDAAVVKNWALSFGKTIAEGGAEATCYRKILENFKDLGATVEWLDATQMLDEMRVDVQNMLAWKRQAVERIADVAEQHAPAHVYDVNLKYDYHNAKRLYDPRSNDDDQRRAWNLEWKPLDLYRHSNFENARVNNGCSSIHVPTNVYDKNPDVINSIKWSEYLNPTFKNNMAIDPSLSWQFFGSSTGYLRIYPAMQWIEGEGPDMYDCRMRNWYIQAAASAKDIVILLDGSGSMTGLRKEIARNVVFSILDTLSKDDFVTILRFSDIIGPVVPCFENTLVQANDENLRELRENLHDLQTVGIANFTLGLTTAFEILQKYNRTKQGSQCNQAIMLITDGAPYTYEEIFRQYNWPNIPVRVFTYLIGREVTDIREVHWMACANRGYYTHVATLAEVQEKVEKYIPVMSRPVVLSGSKPIMWTDVYADNSDPKLSNWLWEKKEREKIRKLLLRDRERQFQGADVVEAEVDDNVTETNYTVSETTPEPTPPRKAQKKKPVELMTTVATPVFDRRNYSVRVANLLGVAGTDVPIREITKLTPAYRLGVNGYSFAITNNGYLLYHPDLRPTFQDMLKPYYSSVDLSEVELVDNNLLVRELDEALVSMRKNMIDRRIGWNKLTVKIHLDGMKRVVTRNNSYYYGPIEGTPFSLAISLPEPYGHYRLVGQVEVKRKEEDWTHYFRGNNWRVHPEWVYCDNPQKEPDSNQSPEDIIRTFLKEALGNQRFRWRTSSIRPPIYDLPICEKDLVQSLVFDAKATDVDSKKCQHPKLNGKYEDKVINKHGIVTTFVASRSGLLRYEDHRLDEDKNNHSERPFPDLHPKATDELFYRRAVDFYHINSSAFIFSVPFDAGTRNGSLVTGSRAIFLGSGKKKAPAAVVGLQFRHAAFAEHFFNISSKCVSPSCRYKCTDKDLDCFLLDNNGFVIVSEFHEQTGKFFGEVDNMLFNSIIASGIYKRVNMFDYQAICLEVLAMSGPASFLLSPLHHLKNVLSWIWGKMFLLIMECNLYNWWSDDWAAVHAYEDYDNDYAYKEEHLLPNKTRPRPCDKEYELYEMQPRDNDEPVKGRLSTCHSSGCDKHFIVQQVPYTNLIMLAVYTSCPCETSSVTLEPREAVQNETLRCLRMKHSIYRQRPESCVNYHPEEREIEQCGRGSLLSASIAALLGTVLLTHLARERLL